MPRMTPRDERFGKGGDIPTSERYTPLQRRRQSVSAGTGRKARNYYSDEHPEIPKVRRASLRPSPVIDETAQESELTETSAHLPRVTTEMTRAVRSRAERSSVRHDEEVWDNEWEDEPRTTSKILVSRRRPSSIYEPPSGNYTRTRQRPRYGAGHYPRRQHLRHTKRPVLSLLPFLQRFTQQPNTLNIVGIVLILTILLFILAHLPTPMGGQLISFGTQANPTATTGVAAANTHQLVITPPSTDHPAPPIFAQAGYLMDADTGATLYAANPFTHLPILSTTKMMTALIAAEKGNLGQSITVNANVANDLAQLSADSSLMGIKPGETYTLKELLYGLMLVSGNDAAVVIADLIAGSQQKFVDAMNARAAQLGLNDTHFTNPHGLLNPNHYSSARDLAMLAKYSLDNATVHEIASTREYTIPAAPQHAGKVLENGDQFLWWYPGADVGKQGWDGASNFVQVVSCVRNNHHLIGAVIHTVNWWTDMRDLMNWGFNTYTWISPHDASNLAAIPFSADWNYFVDDKKENTIPTGDKGRYYIYTGYSVSNPVLSYFDGNKGLSTFGYPLGQAKANNTNQLSQPFEQGTIQCNKQQNGQWQCRKV